MMIQQKEILGKLKDMVQEAMASKGRQDAEKELQKEIAQYAKKEFGMSRREFNSIVNVYRDNGHQMERETTDGLH